MELEPISPPPPLIAKKLWNIVRIMFHMMRKGVSKSKLMLDLHILLKRGKTAIGNLLLHHHHLDYAALTCRSNNVNMSFVTPREYEFSCSNTPIYHLKSKNRRHRRHHTRVEEINVVQKVFDTLNHYEAVESSPLTLLGFGVSPMVRQLRVTDSPFLSKDTEDYSHQVDKEAEEFIKKFYKDLKKEKRIAALESPSPYHLWTDEIMKSS